MTKKLFTVIKYIILLSATAGLFWYAIGNIEVAPGQTKWEYLVEVWNSSNKVYMLICISVGMFSHVLRALRWKVLLNSLGYNMSVKNSFYSVMIGYFVNLVIPRGGEVSRCYNIYKLEKIPVDVSLGTVIAERIIDLIMMILFIGIAFFIEIFRVDVLEILGNFTIGDQSNIPSSSNKKYYFLAFVIASTLFFIGFKKFFPTQANAFIQKIKSTFVGIKNGALAIFKLKRKFAFFAYSWGIWISYCVMTFFIVIAFKETEVIGFLGSITIFTAGGIALTIPMPGGTGSYHIIVPFVMEQFYNIKNATGFAVIFHGWQTFVIIVFGRNC